MRAEKQSRLNKRRELGSCQTPERCTTQSRCVVCVVAVECRVGCVARFAVHFASQLNTAWNYIWNRVHLHIPVPHMQCRHLSSLSSSRSRIITSDIYLTSLVLDGQISHSGTLVVAYSTLTPRMTRTRVTKATTIKPSSRSTRAEVVTIDDDSGEQVVDVQQESELDDSQKENVPIVSSTASAPQCSGLFDKYRISPAHSADKGPTTLTKVRHSHTLDQPAQLSTLLLSLRHSCVLCVFNCRTCFVLQRKAAALPFTSTKRAKSTKTTQAAKAATSNAVLTSDASITFSPTMRHRSLAPLLPNPSLGHPPPTILIVGSAPSEASLKAQNYYAYKYNHFWPITSRLFHFDPALPYQQRVTGTHLTRCGGMGCVLRVQS